MRRCTASAASRALLPWSCRTLPLCRLRGRPASTPQKTQCTWKWWGGGAVSCTACTVRAPVQLPLCGLLSSAAATLHPPGASRSRSLCAAGTCTHALPQHGSGASAAADKPSCQGPARMDSDRRRPRRPCAAPRGGAQRSPSRAPATTAARVPGLPPPPAGIFMPIIKSLSETAGSLPNDPSRLKMGACVGVAAQQGARRGPPP